MSDALIPHHLARFVESLPDPEAAKTFIAHLGELHPAAADKWIANEALMANVLTLTANSPLLGQTMLQQPEHLDWLARERDLQLVKPKEKLREQVARFAARQSALPEQVVLARFKRRELLRIYLRDCLGHATLAETTEELSNLADVLLARTLDRCAQALEKMEGKPSTVDERGRVVDTEFAIVALGKLGSRELNYSSDIDLLFLYSADGETRHSRDHDRPVITNKEFYSKLAEHVVGVIGKVAGEGAVYRIDLRLRPHGRMGELVVSLINALTYYRQEARNWERQSLIKARCAAGSESLVSRFVSEVREIIYPFGGWKDVLRDVRESKEKIDRQQVIRRDEDNVKLGRGGIREIEFIVQALQLYYGGRDPWIRSPNSLIGLERLTERSYITENERAPLSSAYIFLRTLEHRLQMEYGVQTHTLPSSPEKQALIARRMGYGPERESTTQFRRDLERHREEVHQIFQKVFARTEEDALPIASIPAEQPAGGEEDDLRQLFPSSFREAARLVAEIRFILRSGGEDSEGASSAVCRAVARVREPLRTLRAVRRVFASIETSRILGEDRQGLSPAEICALVLICGRSAYFSDMLANHPRLVLELANASQPEEPGRGRAEFAAELREQLAGARRVAEKMDVMRRYWQRRILFVACQDILHAVHLRKVNGTQTALALASIEIASDIALQELARNYSFSKKRLRFAALGLGRISHAGVDYGSDLDLIFVFDDENHDCLHGTTLQEFYGEYVEEFVRVLSSATREGALYRVDQRLRPDGSKGLLACSRRRLLSYVRSQARAWELLAFVKTRASGGDAEFGRELATQLIQTCLDASSGREQELAREIVAIRQDLHTHKVMPHSLNIKWGRGAMFDVYFTTRFLQLTRAICDPEEPGTIPLIYHLRDTGSLSKQDSDVLHNGYRFLRRIDHELRLFLRTRVYSLPSHEGQLEEIASYLGLGSGAELRQLFTEHTSRIESVFDEVVRSQAAD